MDPLDGPIAGLVEGDTLFRTCKCAFLSLCAVGHILAYFLAVSVAREWLNATWAAGETLILKSWPIYVIYAHIHRDMGHIQTCSQGLLQGHLQVIPTIGFRFYGL